MNEDIKINNLSTFTRTYNSKDGLSIEAFYKDIKIGDLSTISLKVHREMAPIYVMPSYESPTKEFARGKRHLAGSLIFKNILIGKSFDKIDVILIGERCKMKILEVELLEEGRAPDILKENTNYLFVAKTTFPWKKDED